MAQKIKQKIQKARLTLINLALTIKNINLDVIG
jgi:hypothetical protein